MEATREWLTPRPSRTASTVACAILAAACALGVSASLLTPAAPAKAARPATASHARAAHCRPGSPALMPGVIPARDRPQLITRGPGHDQSC